MLYVITQEGERIENYSPRAVVRLLDTKAPPLGGQGFFKKGGEKNDKD